MNEASPVRVHPTADVSSEASIGAGTSIWNQAQVRERARIGVGCVIGKNVYVDFEVVIGEFVKPPYPAWTAVGTTGLLGTGGIVEVQLIARVRE